MHTSFAPKVKVCFKQVFLLHSKGSMLQKCLQVSSSQRLSVVLSSPPCPMMSLQQLVGTGVELLSALKVLLLLCTDWGC